MPNDIRNVSLERRRISGTERFSFVRSQHLGEDYAFKSIAITSIAVLSIACLSLSAYATTANMKLLDPDNDGTVSIAEAQAAGAKKFESLDPDHDGTLDNKEAKSILMDFMSADPDKDGTIDKSEYAAQVEKAFKKADPDGDGILDKAELSTPADQEFLMLVQEFAMKKNRREDTLLAGYD